jgi:hypothetical protein
MTTYPTLPTLVAIATFAVIYLLFIVRKTGRGTLDLYDMIMLSLVATVPAVFAFFPTIANLISHLAGVAFPFVVMFGILLTVLFLLVHRLTVNMHKMEQRNRSLVQELGMLRLQLERLRAPD